MSLLWQFQYSRPTQRHAGSPLGHCETYSNANRSGRHRSTGAAPARAELQQRAGSEFGVWDEWKAQFVHERNNLRETKVR